MSSSQIAERAVGAFPVSIATSIALEFLTGTQSEANQNPKPSIVNNYSEFWINIRTLFRNLMGSINSESRGSVDPLSLSDALCQEMETIAGIIRDASRGKCKCVFYVSNYSGLETRYRQAIIRMDKTEKQKNYTHLQTAVITRVLKAAFSEDVVLKTFTLKLKPSVKVTTLILTHMAYDLVSHKEFGSLDLIESHTGTLKRRDSWHTKYLGGKELPMIPFMEMLLPVFGDNETFHPMKSSARVDLIEVAKKYHWSSVTTMDKVLYGISTLKNKFLEDSIKSFK